ncbi:MAG: MATE family efflux transporter [Bacilli bacterium]|nr:MATE family efflux transporter [Bacilli bacterium]
MKKKVDLTEGSILKNLFIVALPILLTTISQMVYNLTDLFWIGRVDMIGMNETDAVAAVGTASYVTWLAFGFILIAKIGTSVKISHSVGEKKDHNISVYATNGLFLELTLGVFVSILLIFFGRNFLSIFPIENQQVVTYALMYLPIIGGFLFFQFLNNGFSAINEGLGQTKINLIILSIGFFLNVILDPILILVFRLGIQGAAIATVGSQFITLLIFYFEYKRKNLDIKIFHVKNLNLDAIKNILRIGLPTGFHSVLFTSISIYIGIMVYAYGEEVIAAQRIGTQIEQLTWMIGSGFQTAITVFVGQNIGARKYKRIKKGLLYLSAILIPYAIAVAAILLFAPGMLMKIFIDEQVTIDYGVEYLRIISLAQVFMMLEAIGAGLFNGLGRSYIPSVTGITGNLLRIPIAFWLSKTLLQNGIWWSLNVSDISKGLILLVASIIIFVRLDKIEIKSNLEAVTG